MLNDRLKRVFIQKERTFSSIFFDEKRQIWFKSKFMLSKGKVIKLFDDSENLIGYARFFEKTML